MKKIILGIITLITFNLNAQEMITPKDVVTNLFIATDEQDWATVKEVFHSKVLLDYSSMSGNPATRLSPDEIIEAWKGILPGFEATHHQIGNFKTSVKEDKAQVFCYGTATHYLTDERGSIWTVVGTYDFDLTKEDNKWEIAKMKFNFKYQDGNKELPNKAINNSK